MTSSVSKPMPALPDRRALWKIVEVTPPEGVPIPFRVAGLSARVYAQVVDILLSLLFLGLLLLALALTVGPGEYLWVVASLGYFFLRLPYYVLSEIAWNGATLGKRLTGLRVVSAGGGPLTIHALTVRNLLKEAEVFLPAGLVVGIGGMDGWGRLIAAGWIVLALAIPLLNTRRQRLGDIIAGTMVILRPQAILLPDVAAGASIRQQDEGFTFTSTQLDIYGAYELQTLEGLVRKIDDGFARGRRPGRRQSEEIAEVSEAIRSKIGYETPVRPTEHARFLSDFYRAQRRHLEERKLFGDARADKFHAERKDPTQ